MRFALLFGACAFLWSCGTPEFPGQTPDAIAAAKLTAEDIAVFDAIVAGYAQHDMVLGLRYAPPPPPGGKAPQRGTPRIRMRVTTSVQTGVRQPDPERWFTLAETRLPRLLVRRDVLRDLHLRNRRAASLANYRPKSLHVEYTTEGMGSPLDGGIHALTLPGYSASHDAALVELSISTSGLSGGGELLYLRKVNGKWEVVAKQMTWIS